MILFRHGAHGPSFWAARGHRTIIIRCGGFNNHAVTAVSTRPPIPVVMSVSTGARPARAEDVHELALSMPHVTVEHGPRGNPVYRVGGKSFVFFRTPRPDAVDPATGQRHADIIVIWVPSESDKQVLVQDLESRSSPPRISTATHRC